MSFIQITTLRGCKANIGKGIKNIPDKFIWRNDGPKTIVLETQVLAFDVPENVAACFPSGILPPDAMCMIGIPEE